MIDGGEDMGKEERALRYAWRAWKSETNLYWKRFFHFWIVTVLALAGYCAVMMTPAAQDDGVQKNLGFIISCVGLVFSYSWFLTNRNSQYMQENWQAHIDLLEDHVTGPLSKTRYGKDVESWDFLEGFALTARPVSTFAVNQVLGLFGLAVWLTCMLVALGIKTPEDISEKYLPYAGLITALLIVYAMYTVSKKLDLHAREEGPNSDYAVGKTVRKIFVVKSGKGE
ncbi:MAG: hypothetical protein WDO70_11410 [Alphaproteobacteria bacterium]